VNVTTRAEPAAPTEVPALAALAGNAGTQRPLTAPELARLLRYGAGITKTRRYGSDVYYSSAGALYPIELYAADPDGLFHFHPRELALRRLRPTDVRAALAEAADAPQLAEAEAVLLLGGILWRTAWKYGERGYRHLYWDAGTMLANVLALAGSAGLGPRLFTGFVDGAVNALIGVDGEHEAALALLALGRGARAGTVPRLPPLEVEVAPLSSRERSYPEARDLHEASVLACVDNIRRYRAGLPPEGRPPPPVDSGDELETAIERRTSVRNFAPDAVPARTLAGLLTVAAAPIPTDVGSCNEIYLVANAVDGLAPGTYRFQPPDRFELLREGRFRTQAAYLILEQAHGALAAAAIFFVTELDRVLAALGNRGYRAAQLEAGIRAGRAQVGACALGLAAVASTFYDDVTHFLSPGKAPLLCVGLGYPRRRR
jgi:SagB-type dehydrogenase family enzyme